MITFEEFCERYKDSLFELSTIEKRYRFAYYVDGWIDGKEFGGEKALKTLTSVRKYFESKNEKDTSLIYLNLNEDGCCEKCNQPINNAEYTICPQCRQEQIEYSKDVHDEMTKDGRPDL